MEVVGQKVGFLMGGEVAAAGKCGVAHDVVAALGVLPRGHRNVAGKRGNSCRDGSHGRAG
jgi:hypothetical protein